MHEEREEKDIERKKRKNQGSNEGSSSDTEKTSGSLFNTNNCGIELSRIKELPNSFYNGYASFDEFLSATSTSDNQLQVAGKNEKKIFDRHHHQNRKSLHSNSTNMSGVVRNVRDSAIPGSIVTSALKQQHRAQDVIDEMNRQYDHNLCLDRFINEMEKLRKKQEKDDKKSENTHDKRQTTNCRQLGSNSSPSTCSSVAPNSNEDTDSGSRNSESIESSTPESGKTEKERQNNTIDNNYENNSSSKEGKIVKSVEQPSSNTKDAKSKMKASSKSMTSSVTSSRRNTSSMKDFKTTFTSESGIEVASSSMDMSTSGTSITQDGSQDKNNNYKGGKLGRKRKRGYIYNPQPVIGKPPKKIIPVEAKDQSYWDKRQRNNEAAKKSREMRRLKVKETHERLVRLKKENEALRVAITLLIQRNESLEVIIDDYEKEAPRLQSSTALSCS